MGGGIRKEKEKGRKRTKKDEKKGKNRLETLSFAFWSNQAVNQVHSQALLKAVFNSQLSLNRVRISGSHMISYIHLFHTKYKLLLDQGRNSCLQRQVIEFQVRRMQHDTGNACSPGLTYQVCPKRNSMAQCLL